MRIEIYPISTLPEIHLKSTRNLPYIYPTRNLSQIYLKSTLLGIYTIKISL